MGTEPGATGPGARITVAIVEDHPIYRRGLRAQFENDPAIEVVAEYATAAAAVVEIPRIRPSVTLMDLQLPWHDGATPTYCGAQAIRQIRASWPEAVVAVITMFQEKERVREALRAGARSYMSKSAPPNEVIDKIHLTAQGKGILDPQVVDWLSELMPVANNASTFFPSLSTRENEILNLAAAGRTNPQIARELGISPKTVANKWTDIRQKLGVQTREQAVELVRAVGLGGDEPRAVPGTIGTVRPLLPGKLGAPGYRA